MGSLNNRLLVPLLGAILLLASCETSEQRHPTVTPPVGATAPTLTSETATSSAKKPAVQEKLVPKTDPVEDLVARVAREYQAGMANYNAGHLEAAKDSFDRAFNMLVESPLNVRNDERLERQFEKLIEGTYNLELVALKEGDGFTEQRAEPAPIDEANEVTFPIDPNVRAKAEEEVKTTQSDLPLVLNDAVASYISYFSTGGGRHFLEHGWIRSGRYRAMISRILKEEGVPQDLIYLAQAESGFHPLALSRVGARGMWQFMAGRGLEYGLQRNWWQDDRQDPEKSTRAAARHLKDLYKQFGDWYLVMAAYNSGPGTVQRAVQRTGYADYWELYKRGVLPAETRNYVPIILAITIMSKNPAQYGLERIHNDHPLEYDTLKVDYPVDLRLVAECVDTSVASLQDLNPSLTRMTTPKDGHFLLHVPVGTKDKYETAIAAIPRDKRVSWHYHKVLSGDTLALLAKKYHTTPEAIAKVNNLTGDELGEYRKLVIPVTPGKQREGTLAFSRAVTKYTVRKGDTVESVADDFGVPVSKLRTWNRLRGNTLKAGRVLSIHKALADSEPTRMASSSSRATKSGKMVEVAEEREDTPGACMKWGRRKGKRVCMARVKASKPRKSVEVAEEKRHVRSANEGRHQVAPKVVHHTVRKGETLTSIASAYNTTVSALKRANPRLAASVKAGSVVVINRSASD